MLGGPIEAFFAFSLFFHEFLVVLPFLLQPMHVFREGHDVVEKALWIAFQTDPPLATGFASFVESLKSLTMLKWTMIPPFLRTSGDGSGLRSGLVFGIATWVFIASIISIVL